MSTTTDTSSVSNVVNTLVGVATAGVGGVSPPPPPPSEKEYRWYRCNFEDPLHTKCHAIPSSEMHEIKPYPTRLYPIKNWVPQFCDKGILRYRLFADRSLTCVSDTETKSPTTEQ